MARDPILDIPDWSMVFNEALDFDTWRERAAEDEEQRQKLDASVADLALDPVVAAAAQALPSAVSVLVFAECWCPDVLRHVPVIQRLCEESGKAQAKYLLREQHPELLARYLTFGGEAIPKMVFFNAEFTEVGEWGPMPAACRRLIAQGRACGDMKAARKLVFAAYDADPDRLQPQQELLDHLRIGATTSLRAPG